MNALATTQAPAAIGPYSQAIQANGLVFVSGQLPLDPSSGILETEIAGATARSLENIKAILAEAGLSLADVVRTTVYLANMADFTAMNDVYSRYFTAPFPARAAVQVAALPKGAVIEIDCIACENRAGN